MMNDLTFVPITQHYYPEPYKVYEVVFKLGFIPFSLHLIDTTKIDQLDATRLSMLIPKYDYLKHRYMCIMTVEGIYWIWYSTDNINEGETEFKKIQKTLQQGDSVIFKHLGGIRRPIRLSWRAIEFEW